MSGGEVWSGLFGVYSLILIVPLSSTFPSSVALIIILYNAIFYMKILSFSSFGQVSSYFPNKIVALFGLKSSWVTSISALNN